MKASEAMTKNVITMEAETTIAEAISKMRDNNIHTIPVVRDGKYVGILSNREILRRRSVQASSKIVHFAVPSPGISAEDELLAVAEKLHESGLIALPVLNKNKVTGIISRTDLMKHLDELFNARNLKCRDLLTENTESVDEKDSAESAVDKMRQANRSEIFVVDVSGKYRGFINFESASKEMFGFKEKISYGQYTSGKNAITITSGSIMYNLSPLSPDDPLQDAADLMVEKHLHSIPVVDENEKLIGSVDMDVIIDAAVGASKEDGVLVNISGLFPGDEDLYDTAYFLADKFIGKFHRITGHKNGTLNINVQRYKTEGSTKYSVRTRLISGRISMSVDQHDWNFGKCISQIFEDYEKRLKKLKEKN